MTGRMTLMVLALVGLMVLVVTVSPPDQTVRNRGSAATATPSPRTAALSDPDAFDVSETFSTAAGAVQKTVDAEVGDRVEITVEGSTADSVALGDLDVEDLEAGFPARFELLADTPGTYPLVLGNDERRIGTLEVR
jgi:hypothetical protein